METDEYGHLVGDDRTTDPYGSMEYAIGTADDFHCFDYRFFHHENVWHFVLHSVVNSETGHFIQDASYDIVDTYDCKAYGDFETKIAKIVKQRIDEAMDWLVDSGDKPLRHDRKGWNQDTCYLMRSVAKGLAYEMGYEHNWSRISDRQMRFGGKRIDNIVIQIMDTELPNRM